MSWIFRPKNPIDKAAGELTAELIACMKRIEAAEMRVLRLYQQAADDPALEPASLPESDQPLDSSTAPLPTIVP